MYSVCIFLSICLCIQLNWFVFMFVTIQFACLFVGDLSVYMFVHVLICLSVYVLVCQSVCLPVFHVVCLSVCLSM